MVVYTRGVAGVMSAAAAYCGGVSAGVVGGIKVLLTRGVVGVTTTVSA
jgi:hypothetical protein